jgi:hypothetical protein
MGTLSLGLLINSFECSRITENYNTGTDGNFVLGHVVVNVSVVKIKIMYCVFAL